MTQAQAYLRGLPEYGTARLVSLYSDLSGQKQSDRTAFRAKVDWWAATLQEACWHGVQSDGRLGTHDALVLHVDDDMADRWAIASVGKPLCIAAAVVRRARAVELTDSKR